MRKAIDVTGQRFGRLLVIERAGTDKVGQATFRCMCDCGKEHIARGYPLRNGIVRSCGCYSKDIGPSRNLKHGHTATGWMSREYSSWVSMIRRCEEVNYHGKRHYADRGIRVCQRWRESFQAFLEDMGSRPPKTTLDRIDPNGNYEPANCRWADDFTQQNNRTNTRRISFDGISLTASEWGMKLGIPGKRISRRLNKGWTIEEALGTPVGQKRRRVADPL